MIARKPKRIDLYESFFEKAPISREQEQRLAIVLFPLLLVVIMAGFYGFLRIQISHLDRQIAPVKTYLNTTDTQTMHQRADMLKRKYDSIVSLTEAMITAEAAVDSFPHLDKEMLSAVYDLTEAKVTVMNLAYNGTTGILHITVDTSRPESGLDYIERLRQSGHFTGLTHTGYSGENAENTPYTIEIFGALPSPKEVQP
ncbi:MAG: hypothetical protein RSD07_12175 [Angelakisella sp.]